jgi:hypothetical protein
MKQLMPRPKVVSSRTGVEHYYRTVFGSSRTLCGKPVPQYRGWFGPIDAPPTCARCIRMWASDAPTA